MQKGKEITIYDIARKLNISPTTVSRALNDNTAVSVSTRKKVVALAESLGYRQNLFASSLRLQKTNTIGVNERSSMGNASLAGN